MADIASIDELLKNGKIVRLRAILPADASRFLGLRERIAKETDFTMLFEGMYFSNLDAVEKQLKQQLEHPFHLNIGAFIDEELIGYLGVSVPHFDHPWFSHVGYFAMYVLKDCWGLGVGKRLLDLSEQHAKSWGVIKMEALVRSDNQRGLQLYQKSGYQIEGTRKSAVKVDRAFIDQFFIFKMI